ncbi:MAG TPA: ABC transporter ATP-binding protein, partial [Candidatus Thermoplasmatota archaeon]|nr:ABC transporter ATP-binding protein [Candidatus Thermoplasmatota archaeon]
MLLAENLRRDYGRTHALAGVSLRVEDGETVALLGPNGAGKSTLLLILAGVLSADGGRAEVAGLRIPGDEPRLGERVGFVPQGESLYPELTVRETLAFFGRLHGVARAQVGERSDRLLAEMALADRAGSR